MTEEPYNCNADNACPAPCVEYFPTMEKFKNYICKILQTYFSDPANLHESIGDALDCLAGPGNLNITVGRTDSNSTVQFPAIFVQDGGEGMTFQKRFITSGQSGELVQDGITEYTRDCIGHLEIQCTHKNAGLASLMAAACCHVIVMLSPLLTNDTTFIREVDIKGYSGAQIQNENDEANMCYMVTCRLELIANYKTALLQEARTIEAINLKKDILELAK